MNLQAYLRKALSKLDSIDHEEPLVVNMEYHRILCDCADRCLHAGNAAAHAILTIVDDDDILHPDWPKQLIAQAIATCEPEPLPDLLKVEQAAKQFGISKRTIYRLVQDGLPHSKARGTIRIKPHDLQAYLDRQPSEMQFD